MKKAELQRLSDELGELDDSVIGAALRVDPAKVEKKMRKPIRRAKRSAKKKPRQRKS